MRKLFAVLSVSFIVLSAYNVSADFDLVEEAQKIQNKQDELTNKITDAKAAAVKKYEAQKAEREAKHEAQKAEIEAKKAKQQQKISEKKKALDALFAK